MEQKLLVVVSIIAGRNFPRRPECFLEVEARFNGEVLCTDPLPHAGGTMAIDTELAWEMTRKALQQHKLNRTPIKLQCYAVDSATKNRQNVGYVMFDLRTAHPKSQQLQEPSWYGVLNSTYSRLRPQLQVALTLEDEGQSSSPMTLPNQTQETHDNVPSLSLTLDPSGGYYHLLPSPHSALNPDLQEQQLMFTLSLTLSNARQLPSLPPDQAQYYFYYCLLGNDITSEPFAPPTFSPERASIRLKSSRDLLSLLLASQPDLDVHLCCGSDSVAKASFSLNPLASKDTLESTLKLDKSGATVDVTIHLEQSDKPTPPTSAASPKAHPPQSSSLSKALPTSAPSGSKVIATPPHSSLSARRNLTRSFEEASLNTPSSKTTTGSSSSAQSTPPPPPTAKEVTTTTSQSPVARPKEGSQNIHQDDRLSPLPPPPPPITASPLHPPPPSHLLPTTTQLTTVPPHHFSSLSSHHLSLAQDITKATYTGSIPLPLSTVQAAPILSSVAASAVAPATVPVSKVGPPPGFGVAHRYKFSVDLRSVHNTALDSSIRCYLRYSYPFFGCPYPVVVQPPIPLSLNTDQPFTQSYCAFDFATEPQQLTQHISSHPLMVEVWQSCDKSHDLIIGTSKIILGEVLSVNKAMLEGGVTRQICSLRSPITPPPPSNHHTLHLLTLGHINTVLVLEDHGPINQSKDGTSLSSASTVRPLPITTAHQNLASAETVPTWTNSHVVPQANIDVPRFAPGIGLGAPPASRTMFDQSIGGGQALNVGPSHLSYLPPSSQQHFPHPPPPHDTNVHVPVSAVAPGVVGSSVVGSAEYSAAMELEMWKLTEEEAFQEQLKAREKTHMAKLGEEWQKREEQRQQLLRQKLEHYSSLEKELQEALVRVQAQQKQLSERETKFIREKDKLVQERQLLQKELEGAVLQVRTQYEQQLEIERLKSSELQSHIDSLKKQVRELESRLSSREMEFEKYRQQIVAKPESKLQAELSIAQLEKAELERKLLALSKSKQHYKEQWSKALGELAACRQREQTAARERLLSQQQELEMMRARYLQHEEQNSIRQQLHHVKNEVEQLQEQTLFHQAQQKQTTAGSSSSKPNSPIAKLNAESRAKPHTEPSTVDTNVARWIEERDILLQTGVYTSSDPTIQKLDLEIRQALAEHANFT